MLLFLLIWFKFRDLGSISLAALSPASSPAPACLTLLFLNEDLLFDRALILIFLWMSKRHPYNITWQQQVHIHNENNWWHSPPDTGQHSRPGWWEYLSPAWHVTRSHVTVTRRDVSWHSDADGRCAAACMGTPSDSGDSITHTGTGVGAIMRTRASR